MSLQPSIIKYIKECKIPTLKLSNGGFRDEDICEIVRLIKNNLHIKHLNLQCNNITDSGAEALATLCLESLDVRNNNLRNKGVFLLANNKHIRSLDISANGLIDDKAGQFLLESSHHIYLGLDNTDISSDLRESILEKVEKNREKPRLPKKIMNGHTKATLGDDASASGPSLFSKSQKFVEEGEEKNQCNEVKEGKRYVNGSKHP
jgi:hypothetical protein